MSAFAAIVDELAAKYLDPMMYADQGHEFANGADTGIQDLADALKAAEGERFRIDQDQPEGDCAYMIRIESADGRRLATAVTADELASTADPRRIFAAKATAIATMLLIHAGWRPPNGDFLIAQAP